jgi:DNA polymerase-4
MDAFFASVEQRDDPSLRGRPVAVGGDAKGRGVVAAASYEARRYGVRSAMPMARALRLCPRLAVVKPDFARYREASQRVFALFRAVTPLVEPLSLDEAFLDVTSNAWGEPLGVSVARRLKEEIRAATSLTASAGVAPNKFLAKIASGWRKPDGLTVIPPARVESFLEKLPVEALWGVGPVTAGRLAALGVTRLVEVRAVEEEALRSAVGSWAAGLRALAFGHDERPVVPDRPSKSCGAERTFAEDVADPARLLEEVDSLSARIGGWLEKRGLWARTVTIKVRYGDFTTVTRSSTALPAMRAAADISARARALLPRTEAGSRPVRLLGVSVHGFAASPDEPRRPARPGGLSPGPQLPLFDPAEDEGEG